MHLYINLTSISNEFWQFNDPNFERFHGKDFVNTDEHIAYEKIFKTYRQMNVLRNLETSIFYAPNFPTADYVEQLDSRMEIFKSEAPTEALDSSFYRYFNVLLSESKKLLASETLLRFHARKSLMSSFQLAQDIRLSINKAQASVIHYSYNEENDSQGLVELDYDFSLSLLSTVKEIYKSDTGYENLFDLIKTINIFSSQQSVILNESFNYISSHQREDLENRLQQRRNELAEFEVQLMLSSVKA